MKQALKRMLCIVLTLALALPFFAGCSSDKGTAVKYGDYKISRAMFRYMCCVEKTNFLYEAYGVDSSTVSASKLTDNPSIWAAVSGEGESLGDVLKKRVLEEVRVTLYLEQYAKENGYVLTSTLRQSVEKEFNTMLTDFSDKKEFNQYLKRYGITYEEMIDYQCMQALAWRGAELLFGENGSMRVTEDSARKYYNANYATVESIFINTKNKTYPNGKTVALPAAEREEKEALADSLYQKLLAGENFGDLYLEHSDDQKVTEEIAQNGVTFAKGSGFASAAVEEAIFAMEVDGIRRIDDAAGVYLVARRQLNQKNFEDSKESIISILEKERKKGLVSGKEDQFSVDEDFIASLDIASINHVV
ncbi:MAG: peptidylprolyl isomerase [Clostridia bacterium]|nr:peptidylprolyl isomerase [Clostridia bacterium]